MIPIGDEVHQQRRLFPFVNLTMIAICVLVFLYEVSLSERSLSALLQSMGVVPLEITSGRDLPPPAPGPYWITLITSMFLHGGWLHLLGNMLYLFIFGDNVESAMGHGLYTLFYIGTGVIAAWTQIFVDPASTVPSVGASGAIAGVLGAYLVMFPSSRINTVVVLGIFFTVTTLPAIVVIGIWGISQFFNGFASLGVATSSSGGVAYFAHIGGFVAGTLIGFLFRGRS